MAEETEGQKIGAEASVEALYYAGKKDEAQKQFAHAAQLDLTSSEKADLARQP